jgi:hypothetical protein
LQFIPLIEAIRKSQSNLSADSQLVGDETSSIKTPIRCVIELFLKAIALVRDFRPVLAGCYSFLDGTLSHELAGLAGIESAEKWALALFAGTSSYVPHCEINAPR